MKIDCIERTKRMIEVMQAYVDGKPIETRFKELDKWHISENPKWNWDRFEYRIAEPKIQDSINWDHVAPEFKYMARDENGYACLYKRRPELYKNLWIADSPSAASAHVSYRRGTVDWKDSLVIRPGCE